MRDLASRTLVLALAILVVACAGPDRGQAHGLPPTGATASTAAFGRTEAGDFVTFHVAEGFSTTVDARGATVAALGGAWSVLLHVAGVGRPGALARVGAVLPEEHEGRIAILRAPGIEEWFARKPGGIEQGVDLADRPPGEGPLVLEVAVEGAMPEPLGAGRIALRDARGEVVLSYGGLWAKDADGRDLDAEMRVRGGAIELRVDDAGARYPLVVDPLVFGQQAELIAAVGVASDLFGCSVAVSGNTAVIGAYGKIVGANAKQGVAYVFTASGSTWTQQAELVAANGAAGDEFGYSVAVSGSTAVVGAPGHTVGPSSHQGTAYVFTASGAIWTQQAELVAADGAAADGLGISVAIDGDTSVAGTVNNAAYVFSRSASTWTQQAKLVAADGAASDLFGFSVAISGSTAVVGAPYHDVGTSVDQGAAYVFVASGSTWTQQAKLVAADGAKWDELGNSVAVSGGVAVIGASLKTVGANSDQGAAYVFVASGSTWTQQAKLLAADGAQWDEFGGSVAVSGTTALVGSRSQGTTGAGYVFAAGGSTWTEVQKLLPGSAMVSGLGYSAALSGGTAVLGAPNTPVIGNINQGVALAFLLAHANGDPCTAPADCASLFCADGVCCDQACTGTCRACTQSKKGSGADGVCGFVAAGTDPDQECPGAACTGSALVGAEVCDGAGACKLTSAMSCAPFVCDPAAVTCTTSCADDGQCDPAGFCKAGVCTPKLANGTPCSGAHECWSGSCVDGVCCDQVCDGQCEACDVQGAPGTCSPVAGPPHLGRPPCAGAGPCGGSCDGVSPSQCKYPGASTPCGATCAGAVETDSFCDGAGSCTAAAGKPCANDLACDPATNQCRTGCTVSADCVTGFVCTEGACVPAPSTSCSADGTSVVDLHGAPTPCSPYRCTNGKCNTVCASSNDCVSPSVCDSSGRCVAPTAGSTSGCSCSTPSSSALPTPALALLLAVAFVTLSRRHRRQEEPDGHLARSARVVSAGATPRLGGP